MIAAVRNVLTPISEHYIQCALFGGGAEYVGGSLKRGELPDEFVVDADAEAAKSTIVKERTSTSSMPP